MEKGKYDLLDLSKFAKLFKSSLKRKDMPKIFTTGSFEFYFYSNDRNEPELYMSGVIAPQRSFGSIPFVWKNQGISKIMNLLSCKTLCPKTVNYF